MPDIVARSEFVVLKEGQEGLVSLFRDEGLNAYVSRMPFGMQLPPSLKNRPVGVIGVGGSVSVGFAVSALLLAHRHCPDLKYVHLSVDARDHFTTPEDEDYEIILGCYSERAQEHECKSWTDEDFEKLKEIKRQPDFHYYVRTFYKKADAIRRGDAVTLVKYIGGMHDGQTLRAPGTAQAIVALDLGLGRVPRQDGTGVDIYVPRINGKLLEYHFERTER